MPAALQVWSRTFCKEFDHLPPNVQQLIQEKVDEMGTRLDCFPHHHLTGRAEYRLRVGAYRVLYDFNIPQGRIELLYVGHRREIYRR